MRNVVAQVRLEYGAEDDAVNRCRRERLKERPEHAEHGAVIAHLDIKLGEREPEMPALPGRSQVTQNSAEPIHAELLRLNRVAIAFSKGCTKRKGVRPGSRASTMLHMKI